jgi:hypothetical protein
MASNVSADSATFWEKQITSLKRIQSDVSVLSSDRVALLLNSLEKNRERVPLSSGFLYDVIRAKKHLDETQKAADFKIVQKLRISIVNYLGSKIQRFRDPGAIKQRTPWLTASIMAGDLQEKRNLFQVSENVEDVFFRVHLVLDNHLDGSMHEVATEVNEIVLKAIKSWEKLFEGSKAELQKEISELVIKLNLSDFEKAIELCSRIEKILGLQPKKEK